MAFTVAKFGGTSLATADAIRRVARILDQDPSRSVAVVSAPGKRHGADEKVTDALYRAHALAAEGRSWHSVFYAVADRFFDLARSLGLTNEIGRYVAEAESMIPVSPAAAASRGEYLAARLVAEYTGREFVDAADLIAFSDSGEYLPRETEERVSRLSLARPLVVPGFYGGTASGGIATFSRGGSDETGSILAACRGASLYENWTDVNGLLSGDPAYVASPRSIERIGYGEMRLVAALGGAVLSPDSIPHAAARNLPILIRNTFDPSFPGTLVTSEAGISSPCVTGRRSLALSPGGGGVCVAPNLCLSPAKESEPQCAAIWTYPSDAARSCRLPDVHLSCDMRGGRLIVVEEREFLPLLHLLYGAIRV